MVLIAVGRSVLCFIRVAILFSAADARHVSTTPRCSSTAGRREAAQAFFAAQRPSATGPSRLGDHDMSVFLATCASARPVRLVADDRRLHVTTTGDYDDADLRVSKSCPWIMPLNNSSVTLALTTSSTSTTPPLPRRFEGQAAVPRRQGRRLLLLLAVLRHLHLVALGIVRRQLSHRDSDGDDGLNDFVGRRDGHLAAVHIGVFGWREHSTDAVGRDLRPSPPPARAARGSRAGTRPTRPGPAGTLVRPGLRGHVLLDDVTNDFGGRRRARPLLRLRPSTTPASSAPPSRRARSSPDRDHELELTASPAPAASTTTAAARPAGATRRTRTTPRGSPSGSRNASWTWRRPPIPRDAQHQAALDVDVDVDDDDPDADAWSTV